MVPTRINFCTRPWLYCCHTIGIVAALQMIVGVAFAANRNIELLYDISWGALHLAEATSRWEMQDDKTILELALENDIDAPYSCQGGICSTCLAKLTLGSVNMDNNQILTDDEIQDGYILSCQARPSSDEVEINYDEV